uniref:Uncharacterized protein n=1 Tax=viral metagenome TaxID=1070528 RepID=A0A6C0K317_9ZZZZ
MSTEPTPQKQFFSFTEAVLLPVYQSKTTIKQLWDTYLVWWRSEGEQAFGGDPLDQNDFNEFLRRTYGQPNINVNGIPGYTSIYIKYE